MLRFFLLLGFSLCLSLPGFSQKYSGQWKGHFVDNSSRNPGWADSCEYVLDLEFNGHKVEGFSYTYFADGAQRYYTICRIVGSYDPKTRDVEVTEVERTKTNVPAEIRNCFQLHKLTYFKSKSGQETLEGKWTPAPGQGNCGYGATVLSRRLLKNTIAGYTQPKPKANPRNYTPVAGTAKVAPKPSQPAIVKKDPQPAAPATQTVPQPLPQDSHPAIGMAPREIDMPGLIFEKRPSTLQRTIVLESDDVRIDLYDNGEVDGDSVSLFLNGKLIMARQRLSTQALTLHLTKADLQDENDLTMYAENLGSIPPNTALMVVTDGKKRYEVRITSDLQKSGTIRFLRK